MSAERETASVSIRPLIHADLPAALAIQAQLYPAFLREGEAAFASRLDLPHSYCLAADRAGRLVAYLLAHGWASQEPPPVGALLSGQDTANEILFIHDLAVSASGQGQALGRQLVATAFAAAAADGLTRAELIAVEGASTYWRTLGFTEPAVRPQLAQKVAAYGPAARWMTRAFCA